MRNIIRFLKDVNYDILVPPLGLDYYNMTPKQAKENFEWFLTKIPERMDYFRKRCSADMSISIADLDYSAKSLYIVWRWFLKIARMERTPKEEMKKMKKGAEIFGESYIVKKQYTTVTQFIIRDIGMYVGQCFVQNYPQLYWHYYTKPKNEINAKQPVIAGFRVKVFDTEGDYWVNPIEMVSYCAASYYYNDLHVSELYDVYMQWIERIPNR